MEASLPFWQFWALLRTATDISCFLVLDYGKSAEGIPAAVVDQYLNGYTKRLDFLSTEPHIAQADYPSENPMRFSLIDRIVELEPCVRITAVKTLTMTEEYLADHFPHFPVMPGVLMLEC